DLAALGVRGEKVDDLDTRDQDCSFRRLLHVLRCRSVDRTSLNAVNRTFFVDRLTDDVDDAAEHLRADRNRDRSARVDDSLTTNQTFGRVHSDGADDVLAEVLRNLEHKAVALVLGLE